MGYPKTGSKQNVLVLARPTAGDDFFYSRWERIGPVSRRAIEGQACNSKYSVLVVDQHFPVTDKLLKDFPGVKFICSATTGHTHLKFKKRGITVVSLRGESEFLTRVRSVAEFTFYMILALSRPMNSPGLTLNGKTIGIIGLGRIGKHVYEIAKGFRMFPMTYDKGDSQQRLLSILREADIVTIHLSETAETKNFLRSYHFKIMKKSAILINTARGSILNESDLADALRTETIAAAAVDVVANPKILNPDKLKNLVVTPHIAGNTYEDRIQTDTFIVNKLWRLLHAN